LRRPKWGKEVPEPMLQRTRRAVASERRRASGLEEK
jgi:hypothetical protein